MKANDRQVGGDHYKGDSQHWDWAWKNDLDYFQGQITKYVARWKDKNGLQDLEKAQHFLEKYIELIKVEEPYRNVEPVDPERLPYDQYADSDMCDCGHKPHTVACAYVKMAQTYAAEADGITLDECEPTEAYVNQD